MFTSLLFGGCWVIPSLADLHMFNSIFNSYRHVDYDLDNKDGQTIIMHITRTKKVAQITTYMCS